MKTILSLFLAGSCLAADYGLKNAPVVVSWTPLSLTTPFTPDSLPNLMLWLKPEMIPSSTNGQTLYRWPDSSIRNWNVTNDASYGTIVVSNSTLNGYSSVSFPSTFAFLYLNNSNSGSQSINMLSNVASCSWFFVQRKRSIPPPALGGYLYFRPGAGALYYRLWFGFIGTTNLVAATQRLDSDPSDISDPMQWPIGYWNLLYFEPSWTTKTITIMTNGTTALVDNTWGTAGNTEATNTFASYIGSVPSGDGLDADIAEILAYVPALSSTNRLKVELYISNKFMLWP